MRSSDVTRRGIVAGLLASAGMASAQGFRPGRPPSYRGGFSFLSGAAVPAAFTMTQLSQPQRVYQRGATSGGGQGVGQATVPHVMSVTGAGEIWARRRSQSDSVTILQAPWRVVANATVGSNQTFNIAGIDVPALASDGMSTVVANDGVSLIDFAGDSAFSINVIQGTTPILLGDLTAKFTQSQGGYHVGRMSVDATTLASMSQPITPFGRVYATTQSLAHAVAMPAVASIVWDTVRDAGPYNSAGVAEELRLKAALTGVAQGYVSYSVGGTKLASWQLGQANMTQFRTVLNGACGGNANAPGGGWRFQGSYVGGSDAQALGVTASAMQTALAGAWDAPANLNYFALNGGTLLGTVCACPAINASGNTGDHTQLAAVRDGERLFANSRSFGYSQAQGLALYTGDSTHPLQAGNLAQARDEVRSLRPQLGLAGNNVGATVVSASRSGAVITLAMSAPVTVTGNPVSQFLVLDQGNILRRRTVQTVAASGSNLTLTLYADPGVGAVLEIYAGMNQLAQTFVIAGTALVYATGLNIGEAALGLTKGPEIGYSISNTPIVTVPAVTGAGAVNAVPAFNLTGVSPTYAAGASSFGNEMTGGYAYTGAAPIVDSIPRPKTSTLCLLASLTGTPGGSFSLLTTDPTITGYVGLTPAGLFYYAGVAFGTTDWRGAGRVWFSIEDNGTSVSVYADTGSGPVLVGTSTAVPLMGRLMYGGFGLRAGVGGQYSDAITKTVDSVALFNGVQTAYRTKPTGSLTGSEANLIALYNAESIVSDSATTLK